MQEIQKKINIFINTSIFVSLAFGVLGAMFLIMPSLSLDLVRWAIAIGALATGAYLVLSDLGRRRATPYFSTSFAGIVLLILGLVFAMHPGVMNVFPIVLGSIFIVHAFSSGRLTLALRGTPAGTYAMITSILSIICGVLLITNPWGGNISMMIFAGIMMIVYAISTIVDMCVLKKNIKGLAKQLKKYLGSTK